MLEVGSDSDVMYVVFADEPLEMEGSDKFCAIFADKDLADEAASMWSAEAEADARKIKGDSRWRSFASTFYVEVKTVSRSVGPLVFE